MMSLGAEVHRLLKASRLRPNQRLGQHFLVSEKAAGQVLEAARLRSDDAVCEIGCGLGVFTRLLARRVSKVYAVEIDRGLAAAAREACREFPGVEVIHADVLTVDPSGWRPSPSVLVGNLPYYATAPILECLVGWRRDMGLPLTRGAILVQREVADRMTTRPGSKVYGAFSVFVQYWMKAERTALVPAGAFFPAPEVGSAIVALTFRERPAVTVRDEEWFFKVVRTAFQQRRKMLRQSLRGLGVAAIEERCESSGVPATRRPEEVGMEEFARLADAMIR